MLTEFRVRYCAGTLLLGSGIMSNRRASLTQQIATVVVLGCVWMIARDIRRRRKVGSFTGRYRLNSRVYGIFSLLLFAADIYAIPAVLRGKSLIAEDELAGVGTKLVRLSQQVALRYDPKKRHHYQWLSDRVLGGIVALPVLLLGDRRLRSDWEDLGILYLWLHAVTYTFYSFSPLGPAFVDKYRPIVYYNSLSLDERGKGNNRNARYSGHTGSAACSTFFMAKVYSDYHPDMDRAEQVGLYAMAAMPPLLLGWLRTKALKHFPSDVLLAIAIGACFGIIIPEFYKQKTWEV